MVGLLEARRAVRVAMLRSLRPLALLLALAGCDDDTRPVSLADGGDLDAGAGDAAPDEVPLRPVGGALRPLLLGAQTWGPEFVAVGGTPGPLGGVVVRLAGDRVAPEPTPPGPVLWWVWGPSPDRLFACGEGGRVLAFDGQTWRAEDTGLPPDAVLWGMWGAGAEDRWAVGGSPLPGGPKGLLLRDTGGGWARAAVPAEVADLNLYKVWGAAADDVFVVGERGAALRWDGAAFEVLPTPTDDLIFTVHGVPGGPIFAVGGTMGGVILRWQDDAWIDDSPPGLPPLNGVFVRSADEAWATGARGTVLRWTPATGWARRTDARAGGFTDVTLHAVTAGDDVWAVGGDLVRAEFGTLVTTRTPLPALDEQAAWDAGAPPAWTPRSWQTPRWWRTPRS